MRSPLCLALLFTAMSSPASSQPCITPGWTVGATQTLWREDANHRVLRLESAVSLPSGLMLVGRVQDTLEVVQQRPGTTVVRLLRHGDSTLRDLGVPAGDFTFVEPQVQALSGGRALMVWGEPLPTDFPEHALWSSTYHGSGWSAPQRIDLKGREQSWNPRRRAMLASPEGRAHLLLDPLTAAGYRPGIIHLTTDGEAWSQYEFPHDLPIGAAYIAAALSGDRLHIGIVGVPPRDSTGRNALYFRTSRGGPDWTPRQLIFHRAPSEVHDVAVTSTPDGSVHVLWGQGITFSRNALFHMVMDSTGAWSRPRSIGVARTSAPLPASVLPLPSGDVLALLRGSREEGMRIVRFCPRGAERPIVAMRRFIAYGVSLLLHGANGSPVLLTSGIIPVSEKRGTAVWQLTTLTAQRP